MSSAANTIILEDDDDDVRVFSPHSFTQWSALQVSSNAYPRPLHIPVLDDDDLELRLGPSGNMPAVSRSEPITSRTRPEPAVCLSISGRPFFFSPTIDLTSSNDNLERNLSVAAKRKRCLPPPEVPRELKLTCAICMDTMEEETSTICGHIFCRKCIVEAIKMQEKCPTCRKRLVNSEIHRIYLS
eukprot:c10023_g1_i2 orf=162-716(+)